MSLSVGHFRDGDGVIVVLTMMTLVPELTPMSGQTLSHLQGHKTSIKHLVLIGVGPCLGSSYFPRKKFWTLD